MAPLDMSCRNLRLTGRDRLLRGEGKEDSSSRGRPVGESSQNSEAWRLHCFGGRQGNDTKP